MSRYIGYNGESWLTHLSNRKKKTKRSQLLNLRRSTIKAARGIAPVAFFLAREAVGFMGQRPFESVKSLSSLHQSVFDHSSKSRKSSIVPRCKPNWTPPRRRRQKEVNGNEQQQIAKAQLGDGKAFEFLYNRYKRRVSFICYKMTRDPARAEDLTQEAFLQVFRKLRSYRGESAFGTWLHRVTVNVVLMRFRKHHIIEVPFDDLARHENEGEVGPQFGERDIRLDGSLDLMQLERAIEHLPPGYRMIFILHDVEGYEHHEIAEIMGFSIGCSKSQLHKARLKLRNQLLSARQTGGLESKGHMVLPTSESPIRPLASQT